MSSLQGKQLYIFDHAAMESVLVKNEPVFDMAEALLASVLLCFPLVVF